MQLWVWVGEALGLGLLIPKSYNRVIGSPLYKVSFLLDSATAADQTTHFSGTILDILIKRDVILR